MSSTRLSLLVLALVAVLIPIYAGITPADLSGNWTLTMTANLPDQASCQYVGNAEISQSNGDVTGSALQRRTSGDDPCPTTMMATLDATLDGNTLTGTLDGGPQLGTASITGMVGTDGLSVTGTFSTDTVNGEATAGGAAPLVATPAGPQPFPGIGGNWMGQLAADTEIPTLSGVGIAITAAVLLLISLMLIRRMA